MPKTRTVLTLVLCSVAALAQQPVAPTNAPVQTTRGENVGDYNILNSWEVGYRFRDVGGNLGKYRSDVNYGNGVRLLGSSLSINSREGNGRYFDELLLNTIGLGNDPYEWANFRIQKNSLYRYDMLWRQNAYFNPALYIANGQHFMDTNQQLQDHNFTLFPQGALRFYAGYSRNNQTGPALTTVQLFGIRGDEFPLFSNIRRFQDEFRLGAELNFSGYRLFLMRGWERFRDDTEDRGIQLPMGNNPTDPVQLNQFQRTQPWHGDTDSWRVQLFKEQSRWLTWNARFTHASTGRHFIFDESLTAADRTSPARRVQTLVTGTGRRPVTAANLTLTIFPGDRFSITNHTAYNNVKMEGDGVFTQVNNLTLQDTVIPFQLLSIRTIVNLTDAHYQVSPWFGVRAGYQFSTRRVRSIQQTTFDGFSEREDYTQDNTLNAGVVGFRLQPMKRLTINFDGEIGRADRPIYPISERNYHAFAGRVQYRTRTLTLSAAAKANYNFNSISLANHSSRARTYSADASWNVRPWFGFDASYSKLHLNTATGIAYFALGELIENSSSIYISNIHLGYFAGRFTFGRRVEFLAGVTRTQDTGDGRSVPTAGVDLLSSPPEVQPIFASAQTFPLSFTSPMARVSVRILPRVRWNFGYQYYKYREEFRHVQDYRAHTGFTSLSWSF
ncbi:MAG TPA: hypothetical protein VE621_18965 [Bryobacteraceae bacterium]|nr:hypothetical protein [Bryobacteraceae bacterium]